MVCSHQYCGQMKSYSLSRPCIIIRMTGFYTVNKDGIPLNEKLMFQRQKPASVMVWGGVTSTGEKTPLIFIEEGIKFNQHVYLNGTGRASGPEMLTAPAVPTNNWALS